MGFQLPARVPVSTIVALTKTLEPPQPVLDDARLFRELTKEEVVADRAAVAAHVAALVALPAKRRAAILGLTLAD